uniref:Uncharacterized protein n=1 Tax=Oryza nivara TaxID=4536 RepID=A0A0E0HF26_ORYNI
MTRSGADVPWSLLLPRATLEFGWRWHMPEASLTVTSLLVMLLSVNHDLDSINTDQTAV